MTLKKKKWKSLNKREEKLWLSCCGSSGVVCDVSILLLFVVICCCDFVVVLFLLRWFAKWKKKKKLKSKSFFLVSLNFFLHKINFVMLFNVLVRNCLYAVCLFVSVPFFNMCPSLHKSLSVYCFWVKVKVSWLSSASYTNRRRGSVKRQI